MSTTEGDAKRAKQASITSSVKLCSHPIIQHKLTQLRRAETSAKHFRELLSEVTLFLGFEATKDLNLEDLVVDTPASQATGHVLASKVSLVPIMRGGLGLVDSMLTIVPMATVYHIGMYNNPESLLPVLYYNKLPSECNSDAIFVLDVQIGSGATLIATIDIIKEWCGPKKAKIKVITLVSSRMGLAKVGIAHPDVEIYLAAIDDSSETGLPLPGIGDPGNRLYGSV
jgi:uracil phosphoribosyltransferase